jgi:hypothetical protein
LNVYGHLLKRTEAGASEGMLASLRAN